MLNRKHQQAECWSWALEWNQQHRIAGFLGDRSAAQSIVDAIPPEQVTTVFNEPGRFLRFRHDVPLADQEDILFARQDGGEPRSAGSVSDSVSPIRHEH